MNVLVCKGKLIDIEGSLEKSKAIFKIQDTITDKIYSIKVDEGLKRVLSRFKDVINEEREVIYLSDFMTNIDISKYINAKQETIYSLTNESPLIYEFKETEVFDILKKYKQI